MEENKDLEQESSSTPQPMTKADEIKQTWLSPDFTPTKVMTDKDLLSTSVMQMSDAEREDLLRSTGVYASTGQQVSTAIENALTGMNQLGDELMISFGNVSNYITGGAMGKELQDIAYDSMARRYEYMAMNEDAVGGIRSELAQLAGGATSFLQLALEGLATGGYLSLAHIGAQSFGEGTYNDMKAYADKHDGSLEGYKPQGVDLAINTANAIMQVATEEILGVGRVGFIKSAALRGGIKEGLGGFVQEATQGALADLAEAMKGNEEYSVLLDNIDQYVRDGIIGGVLQGPLGAASYHHYHAKATNTLSGAIAKARGHETPTAEDQQQAEDIISANERGYASAFVKEFKAAFDASTGEGQLQANIAKAINDAIKAKELDLGIDDETKRAQKVEQIATQETLNAMEMATEQNKSVSEMGISNIVYKDGAIWVEGLKPEVGERAVEYASVLAARQTGLAEAQTKLDNIQQELQQTKKDLAEAKAQNKQALVDKLQARLEKQVKQAEKRRLQTEQLKAQTGKIEAQITKQFSKESAEAASAAKVSEKIADVQEAPKPAEEPKPLAKVAEKTQKPKAKPKSVKAERVGKMKDADIERYDPNKKYNKYDVVKIKTQSGEHIGVWGGDRMWLFNDTSQAQQYIQNDKEITAMREQEAAESERREKERVAKQEQALRDGDGWVDGEYIVQRLKDNDMWEGLSLREKGNLNAIGQVMFINGEVVNAFGNANSKKGTKVTQNTLNTIQKLRDKINEQKQEVSGEEEFLHQETLDNGKNGTTINTPGGENGTAKEARTGIKERIKSVIDTIRRNVHTGLDGNVWVQPSSGDSGVQQTSGVRRVNLAPKYQQQLNELGVSTPTFVVYENANESAQEFREAILAAKEALGEQAASVDAKDLEDYQDMKVLVLSEDKKTGFAITKDGDIVSLFSSSSERGRTIPMLLLAIQNGGTKLDCFDIYLPGLYSKMGFKAVARNNWVEKYKPDGWDKEYFKKYNNGEPDVVFMVYDENNFTEYVPGDGKLIKSGDVDADYGLGMQAQDEALADIAFQKAQGYKHMMVPGNQMLRQEDINENARLDDIYPAYDGETIVVDGVERTVYNSEGKRINKSAEALTNFWRWFGDSKAVDKDGRPLVLYHGARGKSDITEFKPKEYGYNVQATYLATNPNAAGHWAESSVTKKNTDENFMKRVDETDSVDELIDIYSSFGRKAKVVEYDGFYRLEEEYQSGATTSSPLGEKVTETTYNLNGKTTDLVELLRKEIKKVAGKSQDSDLYAVYAKVENPLVVDAKKQPYHSIEFNGKKVNTETIGQFAIDNGNDGVIIQNVLETDYENRLTDDVLVFDGNQVKSTDNRGTYSSEDNKILNQSKVEGTGSDKYRGGYDEKLKRIILSDKSDLTTIQHEFAHYWLQNNFKWARSGLASPEWLRKWRDVEEALGIEPQDRFLSKQASEKFARAYERFIMEGKYNDDLKWAFDGFKEFYDETYEDLKNEYFDLSEELDPAIVDWFNRQRPTTEKALKEQAYKKVATVAMAQGAEIVDKVDDNTYTVSSMNKNGEIETEVFVSDNTTKDSKLVEYSGKKKERRMVKGLQEINKDINPDMYKTVNNAGTVENARNWVESDYNGAWQALNDGNTALIDRTALYQAFKSYAEDGHPEVAIDLAQVNLTKEMTEVGQAMSILSERAEFDPMNIIDLAQKALGQPSAEEVSTETADMHVDQAQNTLTAEQANEIKNQTECKL